MGPIEYYKYIVEDCVDPRTQDWLWVRSPVPMLIILACWYYFIRVCGPKYMKNRDAYSFKTYMKYYNIFQVISNAALVYGCLTAGWLSTYELGCQNVDLSPTGEGYKMAVLVWCTFMLKMIDLSETVVFLLRKKTNQISFLHVYHHITTAILTWMFVKWKPGGMLTMLLIVNCGVHVIMYSYYYLCTGGSKAQLIAGWIKPWITIIQMTQFCFLLGYMIQGLRSYCAIHNFPLSISITNLLINFYLFYDFYQQSYVQKPRKKSVRRD